MPGLEADHLFALPIAIPIDLAFKAASLFQSPLLHPAVTGAALLVLTRAPAAIRDPLLADLRKLLSATALSRSITALGVVCGLGVIRQAHLYLSKLAQNNFRFTSEASRYDWPREIAVVTGAAGGIGSIMAADLAAKGVKVMAIDIAPSLPESLASRTAKAGTANKIHYYQCDLTDRAAVMALAKKIQAEHGDPSILINNAGIAFTHTTLQVSEAALRKIFEINTFAPYWTIQAFLPAMLKNRKGHIAVTASMASFVGAPVLGPYSATKVGVMAIHEALAAELRRVYRTPEVLVTLAHPTFVRTAMTSASVKELEKMTSLIEPEEVSAGVMGNIFSGRGGQVIMPGTLGMIPTLLRGMPHWMSYALQRAGEIGYVDVKPEAEKRMA